MYTVNLAVEQTTEHSHVDSVISSSLAELFSLLPLACDDSGGSMYDGFKLQGLLSKGGQVSYVVVTVGAQYTVRWIQATGYPF